MEEDTLSQFSQLTNSLISTVDEVEKKKILDLVEELVKKQAKNERQATRYAFDLQCQERKSKSLRAELTKKRDMLKKWNEGMEDIEWREKHCDMRIEFVKKSIDEKDKSNKEMADKLFKWKESMEQYQKQRAETLKEIQDAKKQILTSPDPIALQQTECENKLKTITESLKSAILQLQMRRGNFENDETVINLENKIKTYLSGIKKMQQEHEEKQSDLEEEEEQEEGEGRRPFLNVSNLVGFNFESDGENLELQNKLNSFKQPSEMMRMESVEAFLQISDKILANENTEQHGISNPRKNEEKLVESSRSAVFQTFPGLESRCNNEPFADVFDETCLEKNVGFPCNSKQVSSINHDAVGQVDNKILENDSKEPSEKCLTGDELAHVSMGYIHGETSNEWKQQGRDAHVLETDIEMVDVNDLLPERMGNAQCITKNKLGQDIPVSSYFSKESDYYEYPTSVSLSSPNSEKRDLRSFQHSEISSSIQNYSPASNFSVVFDCSDLKSSTSLLGSSAKPPPPTLACSRYQFEETAVDTVEFPHDAESLFKFKQYLKEKNIDKLELPIPSSDPAAQTSHCSSEYQLLMNASPSKEQSSPRKINVSSSRRTAYGLTAHSTAEVQSFCDMNNPAEPFDDYSPASTGKYKKREPKMKHHLEKEISPYPNSGRTSPFLEEGKDLSNTSTLSKGYQSFNNSSECENQTSVLKKKCNEQNLDQVIEDEGNNTDGEVVPSSYHLQLMSSNDDGSLSVLQSSTETITQTLEIKSPAHAKLPKDSVTNNLVFSECQKVVNASAAEKSLKSLPEGSELTFPTTHDGSSNLESNMEAPETSKRIQNSFSTKNLDKKPSRTVTEGKQEKFQLHAESCSELSMTSVGGSENEPESHGKESVGKQRKGMQETQGSRQDCIEAKDSFTTTGLHSQIREWLSAQNTFNSANESNMPDTVNYGMWQNLLQLIKAIDTTAIQNTNIQLTENADRPNNISVSNQREQEYYSSPDKHINNTTRINNETKCLRSVQNNSRLCNVSNKDVESMDIFEIENSNNPKLMNSKVKHSKSVPETTRLCNASSEDAESMDIFEMENSNNPKLMNSKVKHSKSVPKTTRLCNASSEDAESMDIFEMENLNSCGLNSKAKRLKSIGETSPLRNDSSEETETMNAFGMETVITPELLDDQTGACTNYRERESSTSSEKSLKDVAMEANDRNRSSEVLAPRSRQDPFGNDDILKCFANPVGQCSKVANTNLDTFPTRLLHRNNPLLFSKGMKFGGSSSETFCQEPRLGKNEPQPSSTAVRKSEKLESVYESKMKKLKQGLDGEKENLPETFTFSADNFPSKHLSSDCIKKTAEKKHQQHRAKEISTTDETMDVASLCTTRDGEHEFTSKDASSDFHQPAFIFHDVQPYGPVSASPKSQKSSRCSSPFGSYQPPMGALTNFSTAENQSLKANDAQAHSTSKHLAFVSDLSPHVAKDFAHSATAQQASTVSEAHTPFDFDKFLKPLSPSPESPSPYQMTSRNMFSNQSAIPKMASSTEIKMYTPGLQSIVDIMNKLRLPTSSSSDKKHSEKTNATVASLKPEHTMEGHGFLSGFSKKN